MSEYRLVSPAVASRELARVFVDADIARIEVLEEKCFDQGKYWSLGDIHLRATSRDAEDIVAAVCKGSYEWDVRGFDDAHEDLKRLLSLQEPSASARAIDKDQYQKALDRVRRIMDAIATCAVRVGLAHPVFDRSCVDRDALQKGHDHHRGHLRGTPGRSQLCNKVSASGGPHQSSCHRSHGNREPGGQFLKTSTRDED